MSDIRRIGGWSAVLIGIAVLVAWGLFLPTFFGMPPDAMQPMNFAARLTAVDGMVPAQRAALALGFGLEAMAGIFMFPALLAVFGATRIQSEGRAALATGMAALGIPFFILARFSGFSLVELSVGFSSASEVVQAAQAATHGSAERLNGIFEAVFWLFFAWSAVLWFRLMHDFFPRWLAWVGLGAALLGVISTAGGRLVPGLEAASPLALLVLVVWYVGLGVSLLRSGRGAR
jgi:hypothetical protein